MAKAVKQRGATRWGSPSPRPSHRSPGRGPRHKRGGGGRSAPYRKRSPSPRAPGRSPSPGIGVPGRQISPNIRFKVPGGIGRVGFGAAAWVGFEAADYFDAWYKDQRRPKVPIGSPLILKKTCPNQQRAYIYARTSLACRDYTCTPGQAISGLAVWSAYPGGVPIRHISAWTRNNGPGGGGGYAQTVEYEVEDCASPAWLPNPEVPFRDIEWQKFPRGRPPPNPRINPNVARRFPSTPPERVPPQKRGDIEPKGEIERNVERGQWGGKEFSPNAPPKFRRHPGARRPAKGEKEKRVKSKIAALLNVVDNISELSEIVGALYESLPGGVQRRWEGKAKWFEYDNLVLDRKRRGLLDNAGQYGLDGADWKLQALYYNWHLIDPDIAFRNLITNQTSDWINGHIHRKLPNNTGSALDPSLLEFNAWLSEGLGALVAPA